MNLHWLWGVIGIMAVIILTLLIKLFLLRKAAKEIQDAFEYRLAVDTNTLIDISSGDKAMRNLAAAINRELAGLRTQRRRYRHRSQLFMPIWHSWNRKRNLKPPADIWKSSAEELSC